MSLLSEEHEKWVWQMEKVVSTMIAVEKEIENSHFDFIRKKIKNKKTHNSLWENYCVNSEIVGTLLSS